MLLLASTGGAVAEATAARRGGRWRPRSLGRLHGRLQAAQERRQHVLKLRLVLLVVVVLALLLLLLLLLTDCSRRWLDCGVLLRLQKNRTRLNRLMRAQ